MGKVIRAAALPHHQQTASRKRQEQDTAMARGQAVEEITSALAAKSFSKMTRPEKDELLKCALRALGACID